MRFEGYLLLFVRQKKFHELMVSIRSSEFVDEEETTEVNTMTMTALSLRTAALDSAPMTSIMTENWMFPAPCFLIFALFGPIVEPEIRYYQSHLLMTNKPRESAGCGDENETVRNRLVTPSDSKKSHRKMQVKKVGPGVASPQVFPPCPQRSQQ